MKAKKFKLGSIICGIGGVGMLAMRVMNGMEMDGVKNSAAQIIQAGAKTMSRSEYLEMASKQNTQLVIAGITFLAVAAVLALLFVKSSKKEDN